MAEGWGARSSRMLAALATAVVVTFAGATSAIAATVTGTSTAPSAIPDPGAITSSIEIAVNGDGIIVTDVVVTVVNLDHTYLSDLRISIISPSGTEVLLFNRRGGSSDDLTNTRFDDGATLGIGSGSAPFAGSFRPESPLSAFGGEDGEGIWLLSIEDLVAQDHGLLFEWSIEVTESTGGGPVARAGKDQSVCAGELAKLEGSASTGDSLTYEWVQLAGESVVLLNPLTEN
ncbi:MAG: proprotein convertase P-domain-containing protein, partial [Actinobacteria bacterium]|nr:proprotein convertase P-domain-containing protein [Actinomycetota bacterium]